MNRFHLIVLSIVLLISILVSACDSNNADLKAFIDTKKTQAKPKPQKLPEVAVLQIPEFMPASKDPFAVPVIQSNTVAKKPGHILTPLEQHTLEDLRLVGVINQGSKHWALIEVKSSELVYSVSDGDYIGNHNGRISSISNKKVIITEKFKLPSGRWKEETRELKL